MGVILPLARVSFRPPVGDLLGPSLQGPRKLQMVQRLGHSGLIGLDFFDHRSFLGTAKAPTSRNWPDRMKVRGRSEAAGSR